MIERSQSVSEAWRIVPSLVVSFFLLPGWLEKAFIDPQREHGLAHSISIKEGGLVGNGKDHSSPYRETFWPVRQVILSLELEVRKAGIHY